MVKKVQPKREAVAFAYKFIQACMLARLNEASRYAACFTREQLVGIPETTLDALFDLVNDVVSRARFPSVEVAILEISKKAKNTNWSAGFRGFPSSWQNDFGFQTPAGLSGLNEFDLEKAIRPEREQREFSRKVLPKLESYFSTSFFEQFGVYLTGELKLPKDTPFLAFVSYIHTCVVEVEKDTRSNNYLYEIWDYCNNPFSRTRELHHFRVRIMKEGRELPVFEYRTDMVYAKT